MTVKKFVCVTAALMVTALITIVLLGGLIESFATSKVHYVYGDRIFDEYGREVVWRGAGGSYLFHTADYMLAWEKHLPEIQKMGINTVRLAFRFPDSSPGEEGHIAEDTLDYAKLDEILDFLHQHNIKAILDLHNYRDMYGDFGSQKLIDNWVQLAKRYRGDPRIVAYELFNEPLRKTWHSSIRTKEDVVRAYANLTKEIRKVDPQHIHIWQAHQTYVPPLKKDADYIQPNVVFTVHRLYKEFREYGVWTLDELSFMTLEYPVETRKEINAPVWLGEFGTHSLFNSSNPEWLITEQLLVKCEEQVIGWNLWMGQVDIDKPWDAYLPFFPLKMSNVDLIRKPWITLVPNLSDYVIDHQGVDRLGHHTMEMWHNDDYVTFDSGIVIVILSITNHESLDGSFEVVSKREILVIEPLTIRNEQGTAEYPGDWNTVICARAS